MAVSQAHFLYFNLFVWKLMQQAESFLIFNLAGSVRNVRNIL